MMFDSKKFLPALIFFLVFFNWCSSQAKLKRRFYFSWGYNKEWYANNNIRISQPSLQNNYTFRKVKGVDNPGWNTGIFNKELTIPQYNYRLGYLITEKWNAELNFDHTKYEVTNQTLHISGTYLGKDIDSTFLRTDSNLTYLLNNGANFILVNAVRRIPLINTDSSKINVCLLLKGGIGFVYPHTKNIIMNRINTPGFQFGGFDAGAEAGLQVTFFKRAYLEYASKFLYARYRKLKIYEGTAKQNLACYEMILSLGIWL